MLRALVIGLLLANALFFAWARGWLAPSLPAPRQGESEPARLAAQVRPEGLLVMAPSAAAAAVSAARAASRNCLEAGPYAEADMAAVQAALAQAGLPAGSWAPADMAPGQAPGQWLRFAPVDTELQQRLRALDSGPFSAGFKPCSGGR